MKWDVFTQGLTSGPMYEASMKDYYDNLQKQYEQAKRQQEKYEKQKREYERQRIKQEQDRRAYLDKLRKEVSAEEREKAAVRAQEKWGRGETPDQLDQDLFAISEYKKAIATHSDEEWYEKAWRKVKDFFLSSDGITATGWKTNEIQASQFSGNISKSREDQILLNMAEDYYKGNRTPENREAIQELNRRKPGFLNSAAVYLNKALDWIGNNDVTGTTGAFLGTDELDKVRIDIDFDENTTSQEALQNIAALRNSYKQFDEESYNAYLENHNKAKYYENLLDDEYKRKLNVAEGRTPNENGVLDGSVDFFNFSKLAYQLPGIIAGSISSPSQLISSIGTGALTAGRIAATAAAAGAAVVGTGGWGSVAIPGILAATGTAATFGLNQAQGAHENAAEVDEGYVSKVKYALDQHPGAAADFYEKGRAILGEGATDEDIIVAKLANRIPATNKIIDKAFDEAAIGNQRQYDRDMVATTGDSTIDTALQITPFKFFTTLGKTAVKANIRSSRIARAANKVAEKFSKLDAGDGGALRKAFTKYGATVSPVASAIGGATGTVLDNMLGRIPKVNAAIKAMSNFDIAKIKKLGPKTSNWINYGESIAGRGFKSALSEGIEEGKQYYNQQLALQEFQEGLKNGNLSYETQTILGDLLDDFQAGNFAASGLVQAMTGIPMLDYLQYTDTNIINAAEAIKNIKSGMVGGHGQTTFMTALSGAKQSIGTSNNIDDFELAIRALEQNKMAAQKQFAVDEILARTNGKYIASAIDYLKNSNSIKLTPQELDDLQSRAQEVSGLARSPYTKALAKELGIPKENYNKFVADYMYHKDNLETERENLQGAIRDLDTKAKEIRLESDKIANPSDVIFEEWTKNDIENERIYFENNKSEQVRRLKTNIKALNDRLEKEALTNSQKAEIQEEIASEEEALKKAEESKFDTSKKLSYAQSRFDRINTVARIQGVVRQLNFLNTMLSTIGDGNVTGKVFIKSQIDATAELLNSYLKGNKLGGKQLTADNIQDINTFISIVARNIERADQDNMAIMGASAELTGQINALSQAYQEHANAVLNYNIAYSLFNDFVGYNVNDNNEIVSGDTKGSRRVKGNAKEHLEGILAAQDDDAKLEQAYQQGFADYGFKGVYKDESPTVQDQEQQEEEEKPGTIERRRRIKELGDKIRDFSQRAKNYISGKWKRIGNKKIFMPDKPGEGVELDQSENQSDILEYYRQLIDDYQAADDAEKWLNDRQGDNAFRLIESYLRTKSMTDDVSLVMNVGSNVMELFYKPQIDGSSHPVKIGTVTPIIQSNKTDGATTNVIGFKVDGFDLDKIGDISYLEELCKQLESPKNEIKPKAPVVKAPEAAASTNISEQQEAKIQVLKDLSEKMNKKFDTSLRTSSHYFEWVGTGENRKLKLWHRLHDEIGSHFHANKQDKKNWSNTIKLLYSVVYHKGYGEDNREGAKDIQSLIDYLQNYYRNKVVNGQRMRIINEDTTSEDEYKGINEQLLERIEGYVLYLKQEGDSISDTDLYECIKGIAEEVTPEIGSKGRNKSIDRGTAADTICRTVFGTNFETEEKAIEYCKTLKMTNAAGMEILVKEYFTNEAFEDLVKYLLNTKKVYVEDLGYVLWTEPFSIYTEDFKNREGDPIRIAGEIDMLAIDKDGNPIIIDYKTSSNAFYINGKLSSAFTSQGEFVRSPLEQYTNQQSAYIQMLNETTQKETTFDGGFKCTEARLFPIHLMSKAGTDLVGKTNVQFSKDQQLVLHTVPFKELMEKDGIILDKESYRSKLSKLSKLYTKLEQIADYLDVYYTYNKALEPAKKIRDIKKELDKVQLSLQEVTNQDLDTYETKFKEFVKTLTTSYYPNKDKIDEVCNKYKSGEFTLSEANAASSYNNLNWDNPINDNDIEKLGGFEKMGVKDRDEYDKKVDELAHVACNGDFSTQSAAKLTAIPYKTRRGNDKIAVYATITYNSTTYPPIRIYLSKETGDAFAKDVLDGKTVGANIKTTVGLLSRCSDGKQHNISESKQLVEAIGGTEENPYENFMVDATSNLRVAVVTFNKTTGILSTVTTGSDFTEITLPKTLRKASANGHIVINVIPENSSSPIGIPIICNTPQINESIGKNLAKQRTQSLLDFLTEVILPQINEIEGDNPLSQKVRLDDEEIPLTYGQLLNFFFEPFTTSDTINRYLVERPQYAIIPPPRGQQNRYIKIGNFSKSAGEDGAKTISLDDTEGLKKAIRQLSVWVSTEMAGVKWNSSKPGSKQFNEFAKFLSNLEDGERFYLGDTGIYFDKSDANGTYLGFLAKNGLLTTPFNGFSHPLISINSCQEEETTPPIVGEDENNQNGPQKSEIIQEGPSDKSKSEEDNDEDEDLNARYARFPSMGDENDDDVIINFGKGPSLEKLQKGRSKLDQTAARQYIEKVLGVQFKNLEFVDEISSAIVGGLSAGTIIAGQVTANLMKLSNYAQNGTEYHEAFHWAFELIIDPKTADKIRDIVREKYGITDYRAIAEWLADTYMQYVKEIYTPKGTLLQKAFNKIKQWAITFKHMFVGDYQIYTLFNKINSGKFANKPINNEAVLRFQEKLKELNSTVPTNGFEKDGISYKYQQGPVDHYQNIKELGFLALSSATANPAVKYATNGRITINVKSILDSNFAKSILLMDYYDGYSKKQVKGISTEQLAKDRDNPKARKNWRTIDNALALRELLDDEHIDKTQEYVSAYIDSLIGVKGRDLSIHGKDEDSEETNMDQMYADVEAGDNSSYAGSPAEHIIPDHQISRISKTSSRVKLFFATVPILARDGRYGTNKFGKYGYYDLNDIYQTIQNRYYYVLSQQALWQALEADAKDNPMVKSLWDRISAIKNLAAKGNNNAIGLLNEIYNSIKSTKQSHETTKTRKEPGKPWVSYRTVNIMVQNNSFAISREFTDTVLGGFNKFYEQVEYEDESGEKSLAIKRRKEVYDELTDEKHDASYRDDAYNAFFGTGYGKANTTIKIKNEVTGKIIEKEQPIYLFSLYDVMATYGGESADRRPLYLWDKGEQKYREVSVEDNMPYIKFRFVEALSAVGIDISVDQLDDILETQFGGTGPMQFRQLLVEKFTLSAKGNSHKAGGKVTLFKAVDTLYNQIKSEEAEGGGLIRTRLEERGGQIRSINGPHRVFSNQQAHFLISTLLALAQRDKYEVTERGVDGKLNYAMSDDNTTTAMCNVIFDKTGDVQCTKIRQMILDDPFNISNGTAQFGNIPVGSFILPRIFDDNVDYEIVNDAGIETGNNENSSTNAEKRGADTIMSTIVKLCQNMIVLAPFADKSTALSIRLRGIQLPGIDYDKVNYSFRENEKEDVIREEFNSYIGAITVDDTGRVILGNKNNGLDRVIASYVLAEYNQAKKAIQDYKDILRNHPLEGSKTEVEEKYRTAFNICKKLMFMSQFSGDYVQTDTGKWIFKPFGVESKSNKTDVEAAEEMIRQFESIVNDQQSLLSFVNRHINGMVQHELEKLRQYGIISKAKATDDNPNPNYSNILLDRNVLQSIYSALFRYDIISGVDIERSSANEKVMRVFIYDIVGKAIISKQESERLFTGQSDLYEIIRDDKTKIITVPYQDQAKRIGSFASTGSTGVIEDEEYTCAEIPDDKQSIRNQIERSVYMEAISHYMETGALNMSEHPGFDFRFATTEELKNLIPNEYQPIVNSKVDHIMKGFVTTKKNGSENLNNVTDGVSFISANFAKKLLKSQGSWNNHVAKAFDRLTSDKKQDAEQILNDYKTFSEVWTQVIGTQKYTAVGFRTEMVNGQPKTVPYVNKTALFPVFACMCNEKMDAIRRQMETQGVDMLMFESAVKVGAHGNSSFTVDLAGNVSGNFNIYQQKSFFLRKQLNTDPNEKELMKIGIQTVKVALSAAIGDDGLEWKGEIVKGDDIIDEIMDDINNLTEMRRKNLMDKLQTQDDVAQYVAKFLRGNNVPEQIIDAFLAGVPAEALSIQKHIDTLSTKRIQQDTVRINAPGSAFIQRCVYGVEGPNVKFGSLELNDGEELKVVNGDGSMDCVVSVDYYVEYKQGVPYFKLVPKGQQKIKLEIRDEQTGEMRPMSFEEIRKWLKDNNIIGKNAKAAILSYRIPTQAVASINALKCVDVIPVVRDTVVLPKLFTTITGADFDIDKLFMSTVWYEKVDREDGTYSLRQVHSSETEEGLSNTVVNDYIDILCATAKKYPEIFYQSIDQDTKLADDVISWIRDLYPPTEEDKLENASGVMHAMPSMQAKVHDEFLSGRQGIGPFALALVNHVLTRIYGIEFNSKNVYLKHKSLANDTDDDGKSIMAWLSAMINKHVDVAKNPDITYLNVNDSTFNVVALLLRLGYGRRTFMFLCQDIMKDYAFAINQETAVCKYTKNENSYLDPRKQAYKKIVKDYGLKKVDEKYQKYNKNDIYAAACRGLFDRNIGGKPLYQEVLENHGEVPEGIVITIGKEEVKLTNELFRYLTLQLFNYLSDYMAKPLGALQQATVIDNERCITSMIQSAFYKKAVDKIKQDDTFRNLDKLFKNSYIDGKINAVMEGVDAIYGKSSCMDKDVITTVAMAIDPNILSYGKDRMNTFLGTIRDGMVAYYGAQFFDDYCKINNINVQQLFKVGHKSIVGRLAGIQASTRSRRGKYRALRNNLLIRGLSAEGIIGEEYIPPVKEFYNKHRFMDYEFLCFKYAGQSDDNILADVQQAWDQLLNYPDKDIQKFARDLIVYAFYTSGEMSGRTKLFKYVPPSWRTSNKEVNSDGLSYGEFFKKLKDNRDDQYKDIDDIIDKLCRNLWYRDKFVRKIGKSTMLRFEGSDILKSNKINALTYTDTIGESYNESVSDPIFSPIIAGISVTDKSVSPIFDGDKDKCPRYIACPDTHHDALTDKDDSASAWTLYRLVGFNTYIPQEGGRTWQYPIYVQTSVLGEKYYRNNIFEFGDQLEPNDNLDAYNITKKFLSALGLRTHQGSDVAQVINDLTELLKVVNMGVDLSITEQEAEAAEESIDILIDRNDGNKTTFKPLRAVDEFYEKRQKALQKQQDMFCNRS